MADPKKLRADANALVVELLQRLEGEGVQELSVRRGPLRVRVSKNGNGAAQVAARAVESAAIVAPGNAEAPARVDYPTVNAPLTGIFYRSSHRPHRGDEALQRDPLDRIGEGPPDHHRERPARAGPPAAHRA